MLVPHDQQLVPRGYSHNGRPWRIGMNEALRTKILDRLKRDYKFPKTTGTWWRGGKCPDCPGKELYVNADHPWVIKCGREDKCGHEWSVKDIYDDLFNNWSESHKQTPEDPHAAAKAYLRDGRGLNVVKLAGCYAQEYYQDRKLNIGSATVRFPMPDGGFWERLIDRPQRFGKKKANIPYGYKIGGHAWHHPAHSFDDLANAEEIWFAEGIFDAISLAEAFDRDRTQARAASCMSTNNYPAKWLAQLADAVAKKGATALRPKLIFAFDVGNAGTRYTREWVKKARAEGWRAGAAQVRADGEGKKLDWNDLLQHGKLTADDFEEYLGNGDITIAETAAEKAYLLYRRSRRGEFPLTFKTRQLWAKFSAQRINEVMETLNEDHTLDALTLDEKHDMAAREAVEISEIANCVFRTLYFERDALLDDGKKGSYYIRIDFPGAQETVKVNFPGNTVLKEGPFTDHLISVAPGAIFDGTTRQLKILMKAQTDGIRTVDALYFSGYSIDHKAWMFNDIAVAGGRVIPRNDEDFFEIGKVGVKARGLQNEFAIVYDSEQINYGWWDDYWTAFGDLGLVMLSYWFQSLFAEQIRHKWQEMGFLEVTGEAGSGKTTIIMFLWRLVGRLYNYEGFDPVKTTAAGMARELVKFGNLPVVMLEGDRRQDVPHQKKFDWDELKPLFNGNPPRTRGVANGGTDTFAPRFRGSIVIAQNQPITDASTPVLERIMALHVDKSRFSDEGREAGERIKSLDVGAVSHWVIAMIRQEAKIIEHFNIRYKEHEARLRQQSEVINNRLASTHAQLAGALDCLVKAMTISGKQVIRPEQAQRAHDLITRMCIQRHGAVRADHPDIVQFWESFDYIESQIETEADCINHHRKDDLIAISLPQIEQVFARKSIRLPGENMAQLKKLLPTSKARKFLGQSTVNSRNGRGIHCWIFKKPSTEEAPI